MTKIHSLIAASLIVSGVSAAPLTICDFENHPVGTQWTMWQSDGGGITSTATVEADPVDPSNKVLHVVLRDWGCHPAIRW